MRILAISFLLVFVIFEANSQPQRGYDPNYYGEEYFYQEYEDYNDYNYDDYEPTTTTTTTTTRRPFR